MKLLTLIILFFFSLSSNSITLAEFDDHVEEIKEFGTARVTDQCNNSTAELIITLESPFASKYDKDLYQLTKDTCYKLTFKNLALAEHDINIEQVDGENGIGTVALHTTNNTSGPNNDGAVSMNIMTPNADVDLYGRCTLPGHESAGMFATFQIGNGSNTNETPGFGIVLAFASIFAVGILTRFKE